MPSIQDTAYPRFKKNITSKELDQIYTPTQDEIELARSKKRSPFAVLCFLIMFKTFQRLGYFVLIEESPPEVIKHIAKHLEIDSKTDFSGYDRSGSRQRHLKEIRKILKISPYDAHSKGIIEQAVIHASQTKEDLADIINVAIEELIRQRHELPAFSTLQRLAFKGRASVNNDLYKKIYSAINETDRKEIKQLFQVLKDQFVSPWNRLKEEPGKLTKKNLLEHIAHYHQVAQYMTSQSCFADVPEVKIKRFASEAKSLDAARMKELKTYKRTAIAACFLWVRSASILDDLTEMLIKQIQKIHGKAKKQLNETHEKNRSIVDHLVDTLQQIILVQIEGKTSNERDEAIQAIFAGQEKSLLENCQTHSAYAGNNHYPFLWQYHANQRWVLFKLLNILDLKSSTQDHSLLEAIHFLMDHQTSRKAMLSTIENGGNIDEDSPKYLIDLTWISDRWWKFVFNTSRLEPQPTSVNRHHLELCVFFYLMYGLKSGDLFVEDSSRYSDYRTQLISWEEYEELIELYGIQLGLPVETTAFMKHLKDQLLQTAKRVDSAFPYNQHATIEGDEVVIKKSAKKRKPKGLKKLENIISDRLKPVSILEVLAHV